MIQHNQIFYIHNMYIVDDLVPNTCMFACVKWTFTHSTMISMAIFLIFFVCVLNWLGSPKLQIACKIINLSHKSDAQCMFKVFGDGFCMHDARCYKFNQTAFLLTFVRLFHILPGICRSICWVHWKAVLKTLWESLSDQKYIVFEFWGLRPMSQYVA